MTTEQAPEHEALLARLERAELQVARVTSLALHCEARASEDRAVARAGGLPLGRVEGLERRAENYDLTADGIRRALSLPSTTKAADK